MEHGNFVVAVIVDEEETENEHEEDDGGDCAVSKDLGEGQQQIVMVVVGQGGFVVKYAGVEVVSALAEHTQVDMGTLDGR